MKNHLKIAIAAAAVVTLASTARAAYTGDLLVGVYQPGVNNTLVFDLGAYSTLSDGKQWSLGSALTGAGFTPGSTGFNNNATFGVLGYATTAANGSGKLANLYLTYGANVDPTTLDSSLWGANSVKANVNTLGNNSGSQVVGSGADWQTQTIGGGTGTFYNNTANFQVNAVGTGTQDYLYNMVLNTSQATAHFVDANNTTGSFAPDNFFTLGTDGTLTYGVVPEPPVYGILAAFGLIALSLRRQLTRTA